MNQDNNEHRTVLPEMQELLHPNLLDLNAFPDGPA